MSKDAEDAHALWQNIHCLVVLTVKQVHEYSVKTSRIKDPKASTSQISQASRDKPVNPPPAKMIRLEELEQTVVGLVKKSFKQAAHQTNDTGLLPRDGDTQSTVGQ